MEPPRDVGVGGVSVGRVRASERAGGRRDKTWATMVFRGCRDEVVVGSRSTRRE